MENIEQKVYEILQDIGIDYIKYEHEPLYTIEAAKEIDEKMGFSICKNLFLSTKHHTEYYLLFMEGSKKFHTGKVSKQVGVPRMTFADEKAMWEYLKIHPGAVSPLGLFFDTEQRVHFLIDADILNMEKVAMHPCVNTATLAMNTKDFIEKILPASKHDYKVVTLE